MISFAQLWMPILLAAVLVFIASSLSMAQKWTEGPIGFLMLRPAGMPNMAASLGQWFAVTLLISLAAAYLASRTVPAAWLWPR